MTDQTRGSTKAPNPGWVGLLDAKLSGWFKVDSDELFEGFRVTADDTVLDVGCGDGVAALFCVERGARVTYTDIDPACISTVEKKLAPHNALGDHVGIVSDCDPLPVADSMATRVICQEVLEHVADPDKVMSELVRAGRPGAQYLLTVPAEASENVQKPFAPPNYFEHPHHIRIFSEDDFRRLAEGNGLEVVRYTSNGFYLTFWMCIQWALRGEKARSTGEPLDAGTDVFSPPYDDALLSWAGLWGALLRTPEGMAFKQSLDTILPKVQIIIAQKPAR